MHRCSLEHFVHMIGLLTATAGPTRMDGGRGVVERAAEYSLSPFAPS